MRLFRSATCPSVWQRLARALVDRYVTRRETPKGWPSIESVILEHSVLSTTSRANLGAKLMPAPCRSFAQARGDFARPDNFGVIVFLQAAKTSDSGCRRPPPPI
jgi:hypothetical protein